MITTALVPAASLLYTSSGLAAYTPIPGIGLVGLIPPPDSVVLGGLSLTSTDVRGFCARVAYDD